MQTITTTQQYIDAVEANKGVTAVLFTQADINCSRCNQAIFVLKHIKTDVPTFAMPTTTDMYPANVLNIKTVPTLVIFKAGKEVATLSGTSPELYKKEFTATIHQNY